MNWKESEVVASCLENNREAQKAFYDHFIGKMTAAVYRYTRTKEDVEDILQEAFVKVFTRLSAYKSLGSLEGWVRRIVINAAIDHLKKNAKFRDSSVDLNEEIVASQNGLIEYLDQETITKEISELPTGYKLVFNMYAFEGFSHKEIAEKLSISVSTSKTQYVRAKQRLIDKLKEAEVISKYDRAKL